MTLLTIAAYLPAIRGGFVWDDAAITQNERLHTAEGLKAIWTDPDAHPFEEHWWPLLYTSFWIEHQLWGLHPLGYHLVNVLLHAANALLIWALLRRLGVRGDWLAAALFALHPVHVESVAWVIERKDVLSGLFYLLTLHGYARFESRRGWPIYGMSLLLFACAMLTKSVAITLPIALVLLLWWKRGRVTWGGLAPILPFAVLAIAIEFVSIRVMGETLPAGDAELEALPAFAPARWLIPGRALAFYLSTLAWPVGLAPVYSRWAIVTPSPLTWALALAAIAVPVALWFARRRIGKGPLTAVLFFMVTLAPTLGWVNFGHMQHAFVADRFQYLASLGPLALAAGAAVGLIGRVGRRRRIAAYAGAGVILFVLSVLTWRQAGIYRDNVFFWEFAVRERPQSWVAGYNLGVALSRDEVRFAEAIPVLEQAVAERPIQAEARNSLGIALAKTGRYEDARGQFEEALRQEPRHADAHYNLGFLFNEQRQFESALAPLRAAVEINRNFLRAHAQLAIALSATGDQEGAIVHFREAFRLAPDQPEAPFNLGACLTRAERYAEAAAAFQAAVRLRPDWLDARCELGGVLIRSGRANEGTLQLLEVLRHDPNHARARLLLERLSPERAPAGSPPKP